MEEKKRKKRKKMQFSLEMINAMIYFGDV